MILVLALGVLFHSAVVWQDFDTLAKNGYLYDDSFYAFEIARHIANGDGATFDGINPTNGFQPLYVGLLVLVYAAAGSDPITPIYIALTLLALFTAATAYLLFLIIRRYVWVPIATATAALWMFSPVVTKQTANGLETAISTFMLALALWFYLSRVRSVIADASKQLSLTTAATLGVIMGAAMLARVDLAIFVMAMALDALLVARRTHAKVVAAVLVAAVCSVGVYLPWAIYGVAAVGSPFQESGTATRFLSIAYASFFNLGAANVAESGPSLGFFWDHIVHSLSVLKVTPGVHVVFRSLERVGIASNPAVANVIANVLGMVALVGFVWWARRQRKHDDGRGELGFTLLYAVLMLAAYSFYIFGVFFFTRYYYPVLFIATIYLALFLKDLTGAVRWSRVPRRVLVPATVAYLTVFGYMGVNAGFRSVPTYFFYDVSTWVNENVPEDQTIGVFQSGAIGYLSKHRVINLDGKVNHGALTALQEDRLRAYVDNSDIDVIIDHTNVLNLFLDTWDKENPVAWEPIFRGSENGAPGWIGYRIDRVAAKATTPRDGTAASAAPSGTH